MESKFNTILQDVDAVIARDPATKSRTEAILCSSGLHCIIIYRFSPLVMEEKFPSDGAHRFADCPLSDRH